MGRKRAATRIHSTLPKLFDARTKTDRATAFGFRLSIVFSQLTFTKSDRIRPVTQNYAGGSQAETGGREGVNTKNEEQPHAR